MAAGLGEGVADDDAARGGQPLRALFIGGTDKATTAVVERVLKAHPACLPVPRLRFVSARGGLADLVLGQTTPELFLQRMRGPWYESSQPLREMCPPDRFKLILDRFEREWNARSRKAPRRLVRSIVSARVSGAAQMYWVEASAANARIAPALLNIFPNTKLVLAIPYGPPSPAPPNPDARSHVVRVSALLDPRDDAEYRSLITFLGIADHGLARAGLEAEIAQKAARESASETPAGVDRSDRVSAAAPAGGAPRDAAASPPRRRLKGFRRRGAETAE